MRLKNLRLLAAALLFSGCANEGVVIEKRGVDSPFTYSLGVDGSFKLILRDQQGRIHSQLVTPEVFNRYEVGDYFNDTQPGPARRESAVDTSKEIQPVIHRMPHHRRRHRVAHRKTKHHLRAVAKHRDVEPSKRGTEVTSGTSSPAQRGLNVTP